eukprot:CAMPEP_0206374174 /NCGR_PEP_ID=MMETSP0294-20121207/8160_1 /ASSEMBLY_ACC=CAM_ASM_000327 /TAXON_ID=39354 /ORGANISM="Heterosigma akashiwo, Strain CCMP2393" /LENGTH=773 /DNA_ID=CAMNT_0053821919 /DNA_START=245 /DNA_END=2567 /DNA_ORIENTATION=-
MPQLSVVAQPLYRLTSDKVEFSWSRTHQKAFEVLKSLMTEDTLRRSLVGDKNIVVYTDASKFAICVVVTQDGHLVHAASKVLKDNEANRHIIEKEALAISWGLNKMDYYLLGRDFVLYTDHQPLLFIFRNLMSIKNANLLQCALSVAEFSFVMKYLEGKRNACADFGTRELDLALYHDDEDEKCKLENLRGVPHERIAAFCNHTAVVPYTMTFVNEEARDEDRCALAHLSPTSASSSTSDNEMIHVPEISRHNYLSEDFGELQQYDLGYHFEGEKCIVTMNNDTFTLVPVSLRRAFFWYYHFPRHESVNNIWYRMKADKLYFPRMKQVLSDLLSSCPCVRFKNTPPPRLVESNSGEYNRIWATQPLDIVCLDIYAYDNKDYLTLIDVFSRYAFAFFLSEKTIIEVNRAYQSFVAMFAPPRMIICDNGPQFTKITTPRVPTPSYSPQSNGLVERMHKELGNHCRIHGVDPVLGIAFTRTPEKRMLFFSHLKLRFLESPVVVVASGEQRPGLRSFPVHSLVWHLVHKRGRTKASPTYSGPHRVVERLSDTVYMLTSAESADPKRIFKASLNNIKKCVLPSTVGWTVKREYLLAAARALDTDPNLPLFFNYEYMNENTLDIMAFHKRFNASYLVVPKLPCTPWYEILMNQTRHQKYELPQVADLFLDASDAPVGLLPWKHYLLLLQNRDCSMKMTSPHDGSSKDHQGVLCLNHMASVVTKKAIFLVEQYVTLLSLFASTTIFLSSSNKPGLKDYEGDVLSWAQPAITVLAVYLYIM